MAATTNEPQVKKAFDQRASNDEVEAIEREHWRGILRDIVRDWRLYLMFLPLLLFLILWKYLPISSMIIAFKYYLPTDGVYGSVFTGLSNYQTLLSTGAFWSAFRNTFILSFYGLCFGFPFPIILALFFSEIKNRIVLSVVQVLTYLPKFISTVVMVSIVVMLIRSGGVSSPGPIGSLLQSWFGWSDLINDPKAFRAIYTISGIWQTGGYSSIVYFAAILAISPTNYEAARIDGANKMQQLRYVTIPGMAGTLVIMLILNIGQLLTIGYEKVYLLQTYGTDTYETSEIVATYVIHNFMTAQQGVGTAADMFNSLLSMVLVLGSNKIAKKVSNTSLF